MKIFKNKQYGLCNYLCEFLKFYYHNFEHDIQIIKKQDYISNEIIKKKNNKFELEEFNDFWTHRVWFIQNDGLKLYKLGLNSLDIQTNILKHVKKFTINNFDKNTISVHIRTWNSLTNCKTNNNKAKKRKNKFNINNYIYHMKKFKEKKFYVSIDNDTYNKILIDNFNDNIIFYEPNIELSNSQNDIASLLLLSKNTIFIASYQSTYSQIAYLYNNNLKTLIYGDYINENKSRPNPINKVL